MAQKSKEHTMESPTDRLVFQSAKRSVFNRKLTLGIEMKNSDEAAQRAKKYAANRCVRILNDGID